MVGMSEHPPELKRLLAGLDGGPADDALWLVVADWLEEHGQDDRAELLRLSRRLRGMAEDDVRWRAEERVRELINAGVVPCVPEITNSVGMRFALIPAGTFWMGSPEDEENRYANERRHLVTLTRPFWLGVFPLTQGQYEAVMGTNPSYFAKTGEGKASVKNMDTSTFPVDNVSWDDAVAFCEKLSARPEEKACGRSYRLPGETEWEHSCRGGLFSKPFHFGDQLNGTQANCDGNGPYGTDEKGPYVERTCVVGSYFPNAFGLYDMHGNVWEWCHDWYGDYPDGPLTDPTGPEVGPYRVVRGGGWSSIAWYCRSAYRRQRGPVYRVNILGFRLALVPVR
jgi:uncharacterized protein (TIGR02996 family)